MKSHRTHSSAEFTKVFPGLFCNVTQAEVWTVGLSFFMIVTFIQIFVHVAPV